MYLMNAWYAAGWSNEITNKPLARTILDEPIVMYRGADNRVAALEDRCCHRGMPLSKGEVFDNNIRCEYHGMLFDGAGRCVDIPGPDRKFRRRPRSAASRSRSATIWSGSGWATRKRPTRHRSSAIRGTTPGPTRPRAKFSNAIICSRRTICSIRRTPPTSTNRRFPAIRMRTQPPRWRRHRRPTACKFIRWLLNCEPPNLYAGAVPFKGRVDRWGEFEYVAPSCILQFTGARRCRHGRLRKRQPRRRLRPAHVLRHHAGDRGHDMVLLVDGQRPPAKRSGSDRAIVPLD